MIMLFCWGCETHLYLSTVSPERGVGGFTGLCFQLAQMGFLSAGERADERGEAGERRGEVSPQPGGGSSAD